MGGVIKSENWERTTSSTQAPVFNLQDMSNRANEYFDRIRQQAAALVSEARSQADQITEQARQQGRAAALQEAERRLQGKLNDRLLTLLPAFQQMITEIEESKQAWLRHWETETVELAVAIAERLVRGELRHRPEITLDWTREALTLAMGSGQIKVLLNPQDHEMLVDQISKLAAEFGDPDLVEVVSDDDISPGGCRVLTKFGEVDHRLESQLARIEEELT
jgi:flagellar assembly protein FliH